jgi:hypothetical protein
MSLHAPPEAASPEAVSALQETLALVAAIAGEPHEAPPLDEAADHAAAYARANAIARRRHDALAAETSGLAAAGVAALLRARAAGHDPRPAAATLAAELRRCLAALARLIQA